MINFNTKTKDMQNRDKNLIEKLAKESLFEDRFFDYFTNFFEFNY